MKKCFRCQIPQPTVEYYKKTAEKDGLNRYCKTCMKAETGDYYQRSKKDRANYYKKYREKNKEYYNSYCHNHYHNNKELYREWNNNQYATNLQYKLKHITAARINSALKAYQALKNDRTIEYLGCSIGEYIIYMEEQFDENMSWENHGEYWEIDHIMPIDSFDLETQLYEAFHYSNTQPLEKTENRKKSNTIT